MLEARNMWGAVLAVTAACGCGTSTASQCGGGAGTCVGVVAAFANPVSSPPRPESFARQHRRLRVRQLAGVGVRDGARDLAGGPPAGERDQTGKDERCVQASRQKTSHMKNSRRLGDLSRYLQDRMRLAPSSEYLSQEMKLSSAPAPLRLSPNPRTGTPPPSPSGRTSAPAGPPPASPAAAARSCRSSAASRGGSAPTRP